MRTKIKRIKSKRTPSDWNLYGVQNASEIVLLDTSNNNNSVNIIPVIFLSGMSAGAFFIMIISVITKIS